jgi:DNA transformation protein
VTADMGILSRLPNIGAVLEKKLMEVGIDSPATLKGLGSKKAFIKIRKLDGTACYSMLCALEGAVQEKRWHSLSVHTKQDLKQFFESLK